MISGIEGKGGFFFSFCPSPSLPPSLPPSLAFYLFYLIGNPNPSFLQNSHFLSRQFTFKYYNNYFPKKEERVLYEIFKL
jgi:hypothetical protein